MTFQGLKKIRLAHVFEENTYGDDPDYKHSTANVSVFDAEIDAIQSGEEKIIQHIQCPFCGERVSLNCFQQEMVHLSEEELRRDRDAYEKLGGHFTRGPNYFLILATIWISFLAFCYYLFIQSEFIERDIPLSQLVDPNSQLWKSYGVFYLGVVSAWLLGPILVLAAATWGWQTTDREWYLSKKQKKSLARGELAMIITPKMAKKAGLTEVQCSDTRMRLRTVTCGSDCHRIVRPGDFEKYSTGWNSATATTVVGDDIWHNSTNIWYEDSARCAEFGAHWSASWS